MAIFPVANNVLDKHGGTRDYRTCHSIGYNHEKYICTRLFVGFGWLQ